MTTTWTVGGIVAAFGLLAGCALGGAQPLPSGSPAPAAVKAQIIGVLDKGGVPSDPNFDSVLDGYVLPVHWADLQARLGGQINEANPIDRAIAQVRDHNAAHPGHPWVLKLRVTAGIDSPDWAKALGGPPVTVISDRPALTGTVGRFWLPAYQAAYADLQSRLAARYDQAPEIRETVISMCQTVFSEPMIRQISVPENVQNLVAAGYTVEADHACHQAAVRAHEVWKKTISDYTFNPYQVVANGAGQGADENFTEQIQDYCRRILGPRCGLENNSLRVPIQPGGYGRMYSHMKELGPPLTFQLADIKKVGDLIAAIDLARSYGALSVELPNKYQQVVTPDSLGTAARSFKAATSH